MILERKFSDVNSLTEATVVRRGQMRGFRVITQSGRNEQDLLKKDGNYVLEPGSGEFGFIICDMEGNVRAVEGVWPRLSLLKLVWKMLTIDNGGQGGPRKEKMW